MRTRARITLAGLAVGAALLGGVAWATIPADTVYTACKLNALGTIRLIDPSGPSNSLLSHCTKYETKITWNQQGQKGELGTAGANGTNGVAGADGAKGDTGETGATGPQGPAGTSASSSVSLAALDGTPCGIAGGTPGVTAVKYTAGADADAISITCSHPGPAAILDVYAAVYQSPCGAGNPLCFLRSGGTVTVSPADRHGRTSCSTPASIPDGASTSVICSLEYAQGTTVTLTAVLTSGNAVFWGTPPAGHLGACAGTVGLVCTVTLNEHRAVKADFRV